ncbi:MAG: SPOR domain-containing protein [Sphingomonadales bacterium]|nr:SPOR domain-containing protein [Sphingomonadales bacterium]
MTSSRTMTGVSLAAVTATLGASLALPVPAFGEAVADRALSDVKVDNVGGCATMTVNFNMRVQLLSSFPERSGRELHVRLLPLDGNHAGQINDSLRTPESIPQLRSIEYEGDNASGPILSLFFTQDMQFEVRAGQQPQQIVVQIAEPGKAGCVAGNPVAPPPPPQPVAATTEQPVAAAPAAVVAPPGLYVVNLASAASAIGTPTPNQQQALGGMVVYESLFEKDAQQWHRLRAGFFETREAAEAARTRLAAAYPDAWVVKVTEDERSAGLASHGAAPTVAAQSAPLPPPAAAPVTTSQPGTPADEAETLRLTTESEQAIRDGNVDRAIQLLTNAAARPENSGTPRALELLGLARERKGQAAHAQAAYEEYLRRFPNAEGADRVRQRLAALSAAPTSPQLRAASGGSAASGKAWAWGLRGSFSQFYFRDQGRTSTLTTNSTLGNEVDNSVNVNQLLTSADVTISGGNDRRQVQLRAAGSYTQNFGTSTSILTTNNGADQWVYRSRPGGGIKALTALYLDYQDSDLSSSIRVGRQTRNSAGVLGRFDGALFGFQANPKLRVNLVGGFPVLSSHQTWVLNERPFYGVSVDFGNKRSALQTSVYWFDQHARGDFVDRRSVGFEGRYVKRRFNAYTMIDYDVKFNRLNLGLFSLNYNFPDNSNFSLTADYRQSPLLTTTNALIGQIDATTFQAIPDLAGLKPFFTDAQIYQLAKDRTLTAKSVTVTYSRPITKELQVSADFNMTDTGGTPGTPASSGTLQVDPLPATGKEYYYGLQLIGSGLLWDNDIYILSGRYADTSTARIYTADVNARVPITSKFRLSPRVRYGFRDNKVTSSTPIPGNFHQLQPTMRFNYYPVRHSEIEIEIGGNFTAQSVHNGTSWDHITEKGWVLSAGYRLDF